MRNVFRGLAAITMGLAVYAGTADAQMASPVMFGLGGGISISQVEASDQGVSVDFLDNGYHVQGMIGFSPAAFPLGFRGEVVYHSLDAKDNIAGFQVDGKGTVLGGGVNAMWKFPMSAAVVNPYLTGGVGVYRVKFEADIDGESDDTKETKFGVNGGAGLNFALAGFSAFLEARYLAIFTDFADEFGAEVDTRLIPITFGIMFGGR